MADVWNDDAISSPDQDTFGRTGWAARQANLIDGNHASDSSLVYGLEGPWGSGKSSVVAMVKDALEGLETNWHVVNFTPWATSTQEELFSEFFAALASAIPPGGAYKRLRKTFVAYRNVATPLLGAIPVVGRAAAAVTDRLIEKLEKPWQKVFDELCDSLMAEKLKVLVIVDDIDRLSPDELLTLLKVVRLIGRLPGIDYLLAYDEKTLAETLTAARVTSTISATHARRFMEKIVQYPIQLPPLLESVVIRLLQDGLNELGLSDKSVASLGTDAFLGAVTEVMLSRLSTPRAMGRFLAQLRHVFDVVDQGEFDAGDLVLVTFMRLHFPDMHRALPNWRAELTGQLAIRRYEEEISKDPEVKDRWKSEFFETVEPFDRPDATRLAKAIFSRLAPSDGATRPSGEESSNGSSNRMENRTYFDRYIVFEVPDGDVPDGVLTDALEKASSANDIEPLKNLVLGDDHDRAMLVVSRIDRRYGRLVSEGVTSAPDAPVSANILRAAATLLNGVQDSPCAILSDYRLLTKWAATVLRLAAGTVDTTALQDALDSCTSYAKRIEVLWKLKNLRSLGKAATEALAELYDLEGERAAELVLQHLGVGDDGDLEMSRVMLLTVILESAEAEAFATEVKERIASGALDLATVAAWCVEFDSLRGRYVLDNQRLKQVTDVDVEQASEYVDSPDEDAWSLERRRQWVAPLVASAISQEPDIS